MDRIRIPVRVPSSEAKWPERDGAPANSAPVSRPEEDPELPMEVQPVREEAVATPARPEHEPALPGRDARAGDVDWQDLALRLQAEMDNYRKRQQRLAQDQIQAERERLLRGFLSAADDLERALAAPAGDVHGLREGVQLTHREILQWLRQAGVERIQAQNQRFDPNWHEAVSAIPYDGSGAAPGTVIKVLEPGYRLGDRLLRPARVIVAV
jgi:molecular chaperone GrpE